MLVGHLFLVFGKLSIQVFCLFLNVFFFFFFFLVIPLGLQNLSSPTTAEP